MQKKFLGFAIALIMASTLQVKAQYVKTDSTYKKWFVGSSMFLLGNFAQVNSPNFAQLNFGYRITGKDVISLELATWKTAWPIGINPFFNKSYGKPEEQFPGYIRDYGIGVSYQRFLWKGFYAQVHVFSFLQDFVNDKGKKIDNGFQIFNQYRVGYHIKLFKDKFFIQPSFTITHRPYHTKMPDDFKKQDDKWSKFMFSEPGLHFGFNF
ncbi:MAG: hypothetical protein FJX80_11645 [Bacteroidetes bacterium]|nr:hypothetical protein [Bacteroidota bacterium]